MSRRRRRRPNRLTQGDRPYLLALFALLTLIAMMAVGPVQSFTAAAERVEHLERTRDQLQTRVGHLEEREQRLHDPEEVELLAREQLGLVMPGEVPFVIVTPDSEDAERLKPEPPPENDETPWYRRLAEALSTLLR